MWSLAGNANASIEQSAIAESTVLVGKIIVLQSRHYFKINLVYSSKVTYKINSTSTYWGVIYLPPFLPEIGKNFKNHMQPGII